MKLSKLNKHLLIFVLFFSFFISIGYSVLNASISVSGDLVYRVPADIRITGVKISSVTNGGVEQYSPKYTKDTISLGLKLPNLNSTVTYEVTIKNSSSKKKTISQIMNKVTGTENITYMHDYESDTVIEANSTMKILFTYKYDSGVTSIPAYTIKETTISLTFEDVKNLLYDKIKDLSTNSSNFIKKYDGDTSAFIGNKGIYYYYGAAQNNNVMFANYCWKIVRTTDTGGVKLLYNGVPTNGSCSNTGEASQLTAEQMNTDSDETSFSENSSSLADVGYMYNIRHTSYTKQYVTDVPLYEINNVMVYSKFTFADSYTYENGIYSLNNPQEYYWSSNYSTLKGKYTFHAYAGWGLPCTSIWYVAGGDSSNMILIKLNNGESISSSIEIKLSATIKDNADGTYSLINPSTYRRDDTETDPNKYMSYYTCGDSRTTCSDIKIVSNAEYYKNIEAKLSLETKSNILYGEGFKYENGVYKLTNTKIVTSMEEDLSNPNYHHYTCFNNTGECTSLNYVYNVTSSNRDYVILNNGKDVTDVLNEMLYNADVNSKNSSIKETIDYWYSNSMTQYTKYLEDTVWCNDRSMSNQNTNGWNSNGGSNSIPLEFKSTTNSENLTCPAKNDRFTVDIKNGNGTLTYPVGLITLQEQSLASFSDKSPLTSGKYYWTLSPASFAQIYAVRSNGDSTDYYIRGNNGIRPAVSLRYGIKYLEGDGTADSPYII